MIRIITDSTCEASPEIMANPLVSVTPLSVLFGQEALRDGVDITREQFWQRLPQADPLPTTSQVSPSSFLELFERYTAAGDEVIAILISSKFSGTYDAAMTAVASLPGRPIDVIDSLSISVGLGLMLEEAVVMVEAGASRPEIVTKLTAMRDEVQVLFVLDTLEYLQRGGRIGKAQAFVGTLLKFKPVLGIVDGEVVPATRVRGKRKAVKTMLALLLERVPARGPQVRLGVAHANTPGEGEQIAKELSAGFATPHVFITALGPVIGTHVGPGTIGVGVYAGDR